MVVQKKSVIYSPFWNLEFKVKLILKYSMEVKFYWNSFYKGDTF